MELIEMYMKKKAKYMAKKYYTRAPYPIHYNYSYNTNSQQKQNLVWHNPYMIGMPIDAL
ncbi:hypothetical protein [Parageobacillus galactosidasius]|uniref:hypothetical protein n=1 Tax=Parageobacillus galactosidasius TaxID=883812 RepID=UPI00146E6FE7|nr:hypothetical protein [Parageobacillus galactosidasius]